jgi:cytochrome c556
MRIGTVGLAAAALLLATAAASARESKAVSVDATDAAGVIAGRHAGMLMSAALMGGIKAAIDRGDDVKTQAFAARALAGWAKAVPGMFPDGTNLAPTHALPAVWTDRAGFNAKAEAYAAATAKLVTAAGAGDKEAFAAAFGEIRGACGACHDAYKQPDQH